MAKEKNTFQVGRDATSGRFVDAEELERNPAGTIRDTMPHANNLPKQKKK